MSDMNLGMSDRVKPLHEKVSEMIRDEVMPLEEEYLEEIGKGGISYLQIGSGSEGRTLQMLRETYQPGADTGRIPLSHRGEEAGIILSGRLEVFVDGERRILGPGDAYAFQSQLPHRFRAVGGEPCHVVSACTPSSF